MDSVAFDPRALQMLVDVLGVSQVMVGSDYPPTPWVNALSGEWWLRRTSSTSHSATRSCGETL